ncbi:MAG: FHA domain-containing protein [Azoarcus sp.]|nr:FHA domain-containing protein [Azoarcus sp.]
MIWIETLSRNKEPVARVRAEDGAVTIGRGYDNDAIIDDPHVAPRHVRICRDDDGALVVNDLGSRNGLYDEAGQRRQTLRLTGDTLFRIGQTWLRVRESAFEVAAERVLRPARRLWPWMLGLLALAAGINLLTQWQTDISERSDAIALYVQPMLSFAIATSIWIVFWAVLTRLLTGQARATLHAIIVLSGFVAVSVMLFLQGWLSFALSSRALAEYDFIFYWALVAAVFFAHLCAISTRHVPHKAVIVGILALCVCAAQWLSENPFSADESSDQGFYPDKLYPPSWRIASSRTEVEFFQEAREIKAAIDELRDRSPSIASAENEDGDGEEEDGDGEEPGARG